MTSSSFLSEQAAHPVAAGCCGGSPGYMVRGIHNDGYGRICPAVCAVRGNSGRYQSSQS